MNVGFRYPNPPITEALIDIRVELPTTTKLGNFETAWSSFAMDYPIKKSQFAATVGGHISGAETSASTSSRHTGYLFLTPDERQVVQARFDGFTFNRLAPYDRWNSFCEAARHLWRAYRDACRPSRITRLAVRFVNRIDIPLPIRELKDYLRTLPEVSPAIPQALASYFMQLRIPQDDLAASLMLNQAIVDPSSANSVSIVLDIDLFRIVTFSITEDEIWEYFERLRARKNEVFEACITDKARELFSNASDHH